MTRAIVGQAHIDVDGPARYVAGMAKGKTTPTIEGRRAGRPKGSGVKGHVPTMVQLRPDQRAAIITLAEKRREPGKPPPFSEVVRDILDRALGLRPRPPARSTTAEGS